MGMRRSAPTRWLAVVLSLLVSSVGVAGVAQGGSHCWVDPGGHIDCSVGDERPPVVGPGRPGAPPSASRPPLRYLRVSFAAAVGDCWLWSRTPPGLDSWDPANDAEILRTRFLLPRCPSSPAGPPAPRIDIPGTAWEIFRRFPLAAPTVALQPVDAGITGLPTYVSVVPVSPVSHSEVVPGGLRLEVEAQVVAVAVDWGDGVVGSHSLGALRPYPEGTATHVYRTKTCSAEYRESHPAGDRCHPSLDAYPVAVTFRWHGSYRYDAGWVDLGVLERTTTVAYDVDEVIGVLQP